MAGGSGRFGGNYHFQREAIPTTAVAEDAALADRLWTVSEALVAKAGA